MTCRLHQNFGIYIYIYIIFAIKIIGSLFQYFSIDKISFLQLYIFFTIDKILSLNVAQANEVSNYFGT